MKKQFLILFAFISVLTFGQVPQRFNKVIVTGDIISPKYIKTGSTADSVLLGNGSARAISTIKTDTVSLSNRINAKATGNGIANGTNTGDETLTSIKTKLGAATSVSDGYLKYQDWSIFNSKEPAITKNTAFNKNFGTTTGTVLEGRTFGTAANSSAGDFIQNQNSSAQSANIWINGNLRNSILNKASFISNWGGLNWFGIGGTTLTQHLIRLGMTDGEGVFQSAPGDILFQVDGAATFASTVNATGYLLNGNNLTSSLTTNYIPKWNGSSFVNSLVSDDGSNVGIGTTTSDNGKLVILKNSVYNSYTGAGLSIQSNAAKAYTELQLGADDAVNIGYIQALQKNQNFTTRSLSLNPNGGNVQIGYGVAQGYKLAVNGTGFFNGAVTAPSFSGSGANLTGIQLPITLTTNGTSGAATFSGNVLNVPNYGNTGFSYGSYTPILTNVSGVSGFNTISARYTTIGGITTVSIKFVVVASSTSCTFNISLPRSATSSALFLTGNANSSPSSVINGSYLDANNAQVTETFPVATNFINTIVITYE